ncbi:MAG TPA: undecaprenyl-diphosphate phosphatase [Pirellulales bacterium]
MDLHQLHLFLLAVVQGVAEFLPISSSGHLLMINALWIRAGAPPLADTLGVEILLHAGTLLAILAVYRRRIALLLGEDRRVIARLIVGTLPAVVVGLPLHEIKFFHHWLESPILAGCMLPITGMLLLWGGRQTEGATDYRQMTYRQALLIGLAQAVAILPGISRSGSTIVAGLAVGLRRDSAATFSFLLAIPTIAGAVVLGLKDLGPETYEPAEMVRLAGATGVSFVVGVAALLWLLRWLRQGRLQPLAWWCIGVGVCFTVWQIVGWAPPAR